MQTNKLNYLGFRMSQAPNGKVYEVHLTRQCAIPIILGSFGQEYKHVRHFKIHEMSKNVRIDETQKTIEYPSHYLLDISISGHTWLVEKPFSEMYDKPRLEKKPVIEHIKRRFDFNRQAVEVFYNNELSTRAITVIYNFILKGPWDRSYSPSAKEVICKLTERKLRSMEGCGETTANEIINWIADKLDIQIK